MPFISAKFLCDTCVMLKALCMKRYKSLRSNLRYKGPFLTFFRMHTHTNIYRVVGLRSPACLLLYSRVWSCKGGIQIRFMARLCYGWMSKLLTKATLA